MTLSIYIPFVFPKTSKSDIIKLFHSNDLGLVRRVDFTEYSNKKGNKYTSAFVHLVCWYENKNATNLREQIENPKEEARLIYDTELSRYWILLPCTKPLNEAELTSERLDLTLIKLNKAISTLSNLEGIISNMQKLQESDHLLLTDLTGQMMTHADYENIDEILHDEDFIPEKADEEFPHWMNFPCDTYEDSLDWYELCENSQKYDKIKDLVGITESGKVVAV